MIDELLSHVFPPRALTARTRLLWTVFFVLFPLAYFAGIAVEYRQEKKERIEGAVDRSQSLEIARAFALSQGVATSGWGESVIYKADDDLKTYYGLAGEPLKAVERRLAPGETISVRLRSPDGLRNARVYLSVEGRVLGYELQRGATKGSMMMASDAVQAEQEKLARAALSAEAAAAGTKLGRPAVVNDSSDPPVREFSWHVSPPRQPELDLRFVAGVQGTQVVSKRVTPELDRGYVRRYISPRQSSLRSVAIGLYIVFLIVASVYSIYRYARRTLQREISHLRSLVLAALFGISYSLLVYAFAMDSISFQLDSTAHLGVNVIIFSVFCIMFCLAGLLVGIAYGSGEGDLREVYPGKLTSLDALLSGRAFSRNVGAAVLFGAALGGWLLCFNHILAGVFSPPRELPADGAVSTFAFARLPGLAFLIGKQYDAILIAISGLLVPASLLQRNARRKGVRLILILGFAALSVINSAIRQDSTATSLLWLATLMCALLLPFFAVDVLASIVCLFIVGYFDSLVRLFAHFPSFTGYGAVLIAVAAAFIAGAAWLTLRGKIVREEEVRPLYAKNLAERLALQAEVSAAREAQLRLLPQDSPQLSGLTIAATCLPARIVGGDFYDFFPLDPTRLGIFVAEGGNRGLASALSIALAKGFMMHAVRRGTSPTEVIVSLETALGMMLDSSYGRTSIAYAVLDMRRGSLRYARTGTYPKVFVYPGQGGVPLSSQMEREVHAPGRLPTAEAIREGAATLTTGDSLIIFTDGIAAQKPRKASQGEEEWVRVLTGDEANSELELQLGLQEKLTKFHSSVADDLTAVVVRVTAMQASARESVA